MVIKSVKKILLYLLSLVVYFVRTIVFISAELYLNDKEMTNKQSHDSVYPHHFQTRSVLSNVSA